MMNSTQNDFVNNYLKLLGVKKENELSLSFIKQLQKSHIETIGWDTVDLYLGLAIELKPETILDKFIKRKQSGVCYEQNGAFCALLQNLGFNAYLVPALIYSFEGVVLDFDMETHAIIILNYDNQHYWIDAGWSDCYRGPIPLNENAVVSDRSGEFRIMPGSNGYTYQFEKKEQGNWVKQYSFSLNQSPLASFTANLTKVLANPNYSSYRLINCIKPHKTGWMGIKQGEFYHKDNDHLVKFSLDEKGGLESLLKNEFVMHDEFIEEHFAK